MLFVCCCFALVFAYGCFVACGRAVLLLACCMVDLDVDAGVELVGCFGLLFWFDLDWLVGGFF